MDPFIISKLFLMMSSLFSLNSAADNLKTYELKKTEAKIHVTGYGTDPHWEKANLLTDFTYPWRDESAPHTSFRGMWDEETFYFLYRATDPDIILKKSGLEEKDAVQSDRVEIFFKADDKMDPYYALEMDALGRLLDTEGRYPRNIDFDWDWPEGEMVLKASIDEEGYWVEGAISFKSLRMLGLYKDDRILKAGLYRGEYNSMEDGKIETKWISWIIPNSSKPNFHIPSSFGILKMVE